jgi:hypothetical protein
VIAGNVPSEYREWFQANIAPHVDGQGVGFRGPVNDTPEERTLGLRARC